jgi:hypothetical protein
MAKPERRRPPKRKWEDNIKMDLKYIRWKGTWNGFIWPRMGKEAGSCELGDETSVSIKRGGFFEQLRN